MSRRQPVEQSVSHRTGTHIPSRTRQLQVVVPEMSLADSIGDLEERIPELTAAICLDAIGAAARLSAALAAHHTALATERLLLRPSPSLELLDAREAALRLRVSLPTVYRLARAGELPSIKIGKDLIRFDAAALARFVSARTAPDGTHPNAGCGKV
jgi:excisionase family DNA binding protein